MTDLSPAAQVVLDAYIVGYGWLDSPIKEDYVCIAAVLRAVADQAIPMTKTPWGSTLVPVLTAQESRERILAIATELEGQ
jgi:hypothetical protein